MGTTLFLVLFTAVLAGAAHLLGAGLPVRVRAQWVYAQLAMMVGIYVGFAITGIDFGGIVLRPAWSALMIESVTAVFFVLAGIAVVQSGKLWILGALILGHGGVDLLHLLMKADHSPGWYAFACAIYDAIVGVGAILLLSTPTQKGAET